MSYTKPVPVPPPPSEPPDFASIVTTLGRALEATAATVPGSRSKPARVSPTETVVEVPAPPSRSAAQYPMPPPMPPARRAAARTVATSPPERLRGGAAVGAAGSVPHPSPGWPAGPWAYARAAGVPAGAP
ncbi:hypothetical protein [Streptomyces somaliensis]|uniref:hypothetical protein n=1 Tax=Streptomyces somaliensis TaxID=78355 RepID=UPI003F750C0D